MLAVGAADRKIPGFEEGADLVSSYVSFEGVNDDNLEGEVPVT